MNDENSEAASEPQFANAAFQFDEMPQIKTGPPIEKLKRVAKGQRNVIISLGANAASNVLYSRFYDPSSMSRFMVLAIILVVMLLISYTVYQLAFVVIGKSTAIMYAAMMFVPLVSLIVLLHLNQKATKFLSRRGVKVSFLGADESSIDALTQ